MMVAANKTIQDEKVKLLWHAAFSDVCYLILFSVEIVWASRNCLTFQTLTQE
jgi:hypothetical protein